MVMSPRYYKVFAVIGTKSADLVQSLTILYTITVPNFIREDRLPIGYETYPKPYPLGNICDENWNRIDIHGVVTLQVDLGGYRLSLDCIIFNLQPTMCILRTEFCNRFAKAIHPKHSNFTLDNGTIILTIRIPRTQAPAMHSSKDTETEPMATSTPHARAAELREVPAQA